MQVTRHPEQTDRDLPCPPEPAVASHLHQTENEMETLGMVTNEGSLSTPGMKQEQNTLEISQKSYLLLKFVTSKTKFYKLPAAVILQIGKK